MTTFPISTRSTKTESATFRDVMASVATPVTVVTGIDDGTPHGTTVSAFTSLSMNPEMVLVSLDRGSDYLRSCGERNGSV